MFCTRKYNGNVHRSTGKNADARGKCRATNRVNGNAACSNCGCSAASKTTLSGCSTTGSPPGHVK